MVSAQVDGSENSLIRKENPRDLNVSNNEVDKSQLDCDIDNLDQFSDAED